MNKIILIKWIDSQGVSSDWEFKDEMKPQKPCIITSIGFIEAETPEYITIYQNDSDNQVVGRMTIPKACILKTKKVKCHSLSYHKTEKNKL